ncbi:MAG: hypothetical protein FWC70_11510 [Defluviitaleaceae bacterium]|nr:hypothetical protein [Defluviitaleaceae bacterium]
MQLFKKIRGRNRLSVKVSVVAGLFFSLRLLFLLMVFIFVSTHRLHFSSVHGIVIFNDLPDESINGEWSARAVEAGYRRLHNNIDELGQSSSHVVRGEIVSVRNRVVYAGIDYPVPAVHSFYRLKVSDVYMGNIEQDIIIKIMQIKRLTDGGMSSLRHSTADGGFNVNMIRLPLSVGDDLILFLTLAEYHFFLNLNELWRFNSIQGVYRYAPENIRAGCDNWVFESVNAHNNLTLTVADLRRFRGVVE